jgi:predicted transposase YdaD
MAAKPTQPIRNIFDHTLKVFARHYADVLLRLAFPGVPVSLVGTDSNVELALPARPVDFVHHVMYEDTEYLLHVEFQLEHETDFPRRMFTYCGALTAQYEMPVLTLVLYLRPRQSPLPDAYEICLGDHVVNRFSYPVLRLWDHVDAIRSGEYRELAPLLLTLVPDKSPTVLHEERALILQEPDQRKRADLLALAVMVASRHFENYNLWQFFTEEEREQMEHATVIDELMARRLERIRAQVRQEGRQEGIQEGRQEGIQEGRQEGIQEGVQEGIQALRASLVDILLERFDVSEAQCQRIEERLQKIDDLDKLRGLLLTLVRAPNAVVFEQALMEVQNATPPSSL